MKLKKFNLRSDSIVNLYRAAFYLAKGSHNTALMFLSQSRKKSPDLINNQLNNLLRDPKNSLKTQRDCLFWAEKILDEYKKIIYFA